ncbi:MAG TPA: ester cyclase [Streptosporangiaceae bacterium]|jgi:steroid delta-isomerase-like uncharacterized protein
MSASQVLRQALEATATGDTDAIRSLYADDLDGWSAGQRIRTRDELIAEAAARGAAFSGVRLHADPADLADGRVAAEWRLEARHTGELRLDDGFDVPPTGRAIDLRGALFAEVRDGRITAFRQYWDQAELLEQLGLLGNDPTGAGAGAGSGGREVPA